MSLLEKLEQHYWMHQAMEVLKYNTREALIPEIETGFKAKEVLDKIKNIVDTHKKLKNIRKGTPLHLKILSDTLNEQLIELRQWHFDATNWNDHIDYMIEVLQSSKMEEDN